MSFEKYPDGVFLNTLKHHLPQRIVTNENLVQWMGKSIRGSWIEKRTGIRERRWVEDNESCRDLAISVGRGVLEEAKARVDYLLLSTISGDYITPPTAPFVQDALGLHGVGAFDIGAACAGFVTGMHLAAAFARQGSSVLLLSAEVRSKFLNPEDFATACLFGDGAAGCLLENEKKAKSFRLLASQIFSDGSVGDVISIPSGGSLSPGAQETDKSRFYLKMKDGAELFLKAVDGMTEAGLHFLKNCELSREEITWMVPHQANAFLIESLAERMEIPHEKVFSTIAYTGNTSGASVGIALSHLREQKDLKDGDKILLIAAGGGGLAACALLQYVQ